MKNLQLTFRAFSENCFGWNVGFDDPLPELFRNEQKALMLFDGIARGKLKRLTEEVRCAYMLATMFLRNVLQGRRCAPHDLKLSHGS